MINNKDEFKILLFLKGNVGFASLLITLLGVLFTAIGNFLYYIFLYSYLSAWNISGSFASSIHTKQMIIIVIVFASMLLSYFINRIMLSATDKIALYDDVNRYNKVRIDQLQLSYKELHKKIRDNRLSAIRDKNINYNYANELSLVENDIKLNETELHDLKKQVKNTSFKILICYVICLVLCSFLLFVFLVAFFYFSFDNVSELLKYASTICLPFFFINFLYIIFLRIIKIFKYKNTSQIDDADKRVDSTRSKMEIDKKISIINFLNDKSIKNYFCILCLYFVMLLVILPWSARNGVNNQHEFNIVNHNGSYYVLVYYDESSAYLKKCIFNNETINIDRDSFIINNSSNIEFQKRKFNIVNITVFD